MVGVLGAVGAPIWSDRLDYAFLVGGDFIDSWEKIDRSWAAIETWSTVPRKESSNDFFGRLQTYLVGLLRVISCGYWQEST